MRIQLLFFEGCPNVESARAALREAIGAERVDAGVEEIDVQAADAPAWARAWGSPTILIDGKDVAQQQPSGASACRLYAGGAPSVDSIRESIASARGRAKSRPRTIALPLIGALTAVVAASACCVLPIVLAVIGVSGAGLGATFTPYRPYLLIATALALLAGFWLAYRPQRDACGCAAPRRRKKARVALWLTTIITIGVAAYPLLGGGAASAGSTDAAAKATLRLKVIGMDCAECTGSIAKRIKKVPGVVSATVDFESGNAVVRYDGRDGMTDAAIKAVEDAGFRAELQP